MPPSVSSFRPRALPGGPWPTRPWSPRGVALLAGVLVVTLGAGAVDPSLSGPPGPLAQAIEREGLLGSTSELAIQPILQASGAVGAAADAAAAVGAAPRYLGGIPSGTGMWTWKPELTEGGDGRAIVERAEAAGLTHIFVRTGSSWQGFHGAAFLDEVLPFAHAAGIRVYGWDFPSLDDVDLDLDRAVQAIDHRTPGGHRIDGFVADIETGSEGTNLGGGRAGRYGRELRERVGDDEVLIACVPNPTPHHQAIFPYDDVLGPYDAVAPMVYWLNRQPDTDVTRALDILRSYSKPLLPVGQAYDGAPEGGRPGPPPAEEIRRFVEAAGSGGAQAISFWSWQHASPEIWQAITDVPLQTAP